MIITYTHQHRLVHPDILCNVGFIYNTASPTLCKDTHESCLHFAANGDCGIDLETRRRCPRSCNMCNTTVIRSGPAKLPSISLNTAPPKTTVRQREKTTTPSTKTVQRTTTTKPEKEQIATLPNTLRPSPSGIESKGARKPGSQRNVTPPGFLSDGNTKNVSDTTTNGKHSAHL